ncbi:VirB6/TrbL-like conjugal transfer protein, CD1112 family, partial [Helcococcus bovis]|uniref:VirB6/TrbL-like conjugal transfer protein, CD1112 family n=1 Tax=Helcococcus bovis TaxID=3153252 RepID=UPI0038B70140
MNLLNFSKLAIFGWEEGLARDILKKYNEMQQDILNTISDIKPHLSTSPQDYSNDTWNLVTGISSNIVLVIAGLLFAYIMTLELIDMITQKNNYHDLELYQIYVWIFKLGIGILVLQNYVVIMNAIFAIGNWGLEKVIGLINLDMQKIDFGVNEETVKKLTQDNDFMALFMQNMTTFLMVWAFKFIGVLVHVVIIGRYFEIYL